MTTTAMELRPVANVADLPTTTFGHRSIAWWGTIGFIVIEGTTLFICAVSYLYLRVVVGQWAPAYAPRPDRPRRPPLPRRRWPATRPPLRPRGIPPGRCPIPRPCRRGRRR